MRVSAAAAIGVGLALLWAPPSARAEIAVMAGGKIVYIDRYHREDELVTMFLTGGGEVTVPAELVRNIVPNEIVQNQEEALTLALLPQWEPLITPLAKDHGLDPRLVAAVVWVESSGDPNAVSVKGARGLMQLMPATASALGVRDLLDPEDNLRGGVRYLRELLDRHQHNLRLALAAYNAGPSAVARHQGVPPYRETERYVRRILELYRQAGGIWQEI